MITTVLEGGQLLRISDVGLADIGEVYCELSTNADTVTSRLATLTLKKVQLCNTI